MEKEDIMSGFFGAALKSDCVFDVFFGTDYHSHLGTRRAGMVFTEKTVLTDLSTILKIRRSGRSLTVIFTK